MKQSKKLAALLMALVLAFLLTLPAFAEATEEAFTTTPMISGGGDHNLALKSDGTVWAWGWNIRGELGDGTKIQRYTPVQTMGLSNVVAVAAGSGAFSLALKSDGTVWAWGRNVEGQLGDGTTTDRHTPVQVTGLSGIVAINTAQLWSVALKSDGTVWAWGQDDEGQLGDGAATNRSTPVQVPGLDNITDITANLALASDGTVWSWGALTQKVAGLSDVTALAEGLGHYLALKSDSTVWAWGKNHDGQLGSGTMGGINNTPAQVSGLSSVTAIGAGDHHSFAVKSDGTLWAWGENGYYQLGNNTATDHYTPVQVSGLSGITTAGGGYHHSIALKNDGTIWTWGDDKFAQLGHGVFSTITYTPVQVRGAYNKGWFNINGADFAPAKAWESWPGWLQWVLKHLLFGWLWMNWF